MLRLILREALLTLVLLALTSMAGFALLDHTGAHDWWGTLAPSRRAGVAPDAALARSLPLFWNDTVRDARVRTTEDLAALASPATRAAARLRLERRGTAAVPTMLRRLRELPDAARTEALAVLDAMSPMLAGGTRPPAEPAAALEYWDRFDALRGLDSVRPTRGAWSSGSSRTRVGTPRSSSCGWAPTACPRSSRCSTSRSTPTRRGG